MIGDILVTVGIGGGYLGSGGVVCGLASLCGMTCSRTIRFGVQNGVRREPGSIRDVHIRRLLC